MSIFEKPFFCSDLRFGPEMTHRHKFKTLTSIWNPEKCLSILYSSSHELYRSKYDLCGKSSYKCVDVWEGWHTHRLCVCCHKISERVFRELIRTDYSHYTLSNPRCAFALFFFVVHGMLQRSFFMFFESPATVVYVPFTIPSV